MGQVHTFLARQPIFDRRKKVFAYELLYRGAADATDSSGSMSPLEITSHVLSNATLLFGMRTLTGGKPAFVNLDREAILTDQIRSLPADVVVAEVLETVEPEPRIIEKLVELRMDGYKIAIDDFVGQENYDPLIEAADIIKIDFHGTNAEQRQKMADDFLSRDKHILAEKVEEEGEFKRALQDGFHYFQGYFFAKPETIKRKRLSEAGTQHLQLIMDLQRRELDYKSLEEIISRDPALTFKLMQFINSAYFGWISPITSIRHALVQMGTQEIRTWATFVTMGTMGNEKPDELNVIALTRARMCELLSRALKRGKESKEYFLMGMFSLLDAMMDMPLDKIIEDIPLGPALKGALAGEPSRQRSVLDLVIRYERADFDGVWKIAMDLGLAPDEIFQAYIDATAWAQGSFDLQQRAM